MKCPKCGNELTEIENEKYKCNKCGATFVKKKQTPVVTPSANVRPAPVEESPKTSDVKSFEPKMYSNIGGKIKILAVIVTIISSTVSFIVGINMLINAAEMYKSIGESMPFSVGITTILIYFVAIPVAAWIVSFFTYGFGELIEKTVKTNHNSELMMKMLADHFKKDNPDRDIYK